MLFSLSFVPQTLSSPLSEGLQAMRQAKKPVDRKKNKLETHLLLNGGVLQVARLICLGRCIRSLERLGRRIRSLSEQKR
jgi:hypothetical protein